MKDLKELLQACQSIAGVTIGELANSLGVTCPRSLEQHKGWIGKLLELFLGAGANNLPIPDFPALGIELKTIPVKADLTPVGSTYVCTAPLYNADPLWENSVVKLKLTKVLWVPIEYNVTLKLSKRRIGQAFLWEPNLADHNILKNDWQELTEILNLGKIALLSAKYGKYLQIRPKAANCKTDLLEYITDHGEVIYTVARGFYLRPSFTRQILATRFLT